MYTMSLFPMDSYGEDHRILSPSRAFTEPSPFLPIPDPSPPSSSGQDSCCKRQRTDSPGADLTNHILDPNMTQPDANIESEDDYFARRSQFVEEENALAFDNACKQRATPAEKLANAVIQRLRAADDRDVFATAPDIRGHGNQKHPHFAGDHFLSNKRLIEKTQLLRVAKHMPKGAHLHIHFNACLDPSVLLEVARGMDRMFITSDLSLVMNPEPVEDRKKNYFLCEIQFSILPPEKENPGDLFSPEYQPRQTMHFQEFLAKFPRNIMKMTAMEWLQHKLVFSESETHDIRQTPRGAWERFNGRTRMMKGLFNYETAYRVYTQRFLENLLDDNIQHAEIRPNFMMTNQLWTDDGTGQVDNAGIVEIIIEACEQFKERLRREAETEKDAASRRHFDGIKIIYCTPRSFSRPLVEAALNECLEFKKRWPQYIAGFDLVGEEAKGHPLKHFVPEFLAFRKRCIAEGLDIPFLFHCGETLDVGTDVDGNLYDALLLGAKRIGHGFALPRHPHVLQAMKARNVCVEVCPISNEILGLTPRIGGHAVYELLANNMPCTANSDNGTLFRSTLSHDFYQILIGKADMGLYGWRQLAEWSLAHACLDEGAEGAGGAGGERETARQHWLEAWQRFVVWVLQEYDAENPATQAVLAAIEAGAPAAVL